MQQNSTDTDRKWMQLALRQAETAAENNDVPIGCVIVKDDHILAKACNQRDQLQDPTAHAEIIALTQAAAAVKSWRLEGCTVYVTLEPCTMCAGAIVLARIPRLVYAAANPKAGAVGSLYNIPQDQRLNHRVEVNSGILADQSSRLLSEFFEQRRLEKKQKDENNIW